MRLRRMLAIARAEWIHNRRDPRSLVVIVVLPVVLLLLFGYGINYDLQHIPFAVYDLDGTEMGRSLIQQFQHSRYFSLREVITDRRRVDVLLDTEEVVFVLVVPPGLGRDLGAGRDAKVQALLNGSDTVRANVALGYIEGAILDYSTKLGIEFARHHGLSGTTPFTVHPIIFYNPGLESDNFIIPGLIVLLLAVLTALLTSTCIVRERELGSFETLVASPATALEIMLGKMLPYAVMAFADVLLCIIAGRLIFGVRVTGNISLLLAISIVFLAASLSIGILFSALARTQRVAIFLAFLGTFLPTVLLSGFVFPLRSMPAALQLISKVIPATHFLVVVRSIYLKASGMAVLWPLVLILAVFAVTLLAIAAKAFKKRI